MQSLLIAKPTIRSWTAQKVNRAASGEYNAAVGASNANQVVSQLLPKTFLKEWQSTAYQLRAETKRLCAFVYDDGWYAFTNSGFTKYRDTVWSNFENELTRIKKDMVSRYDVMRQHQLDRMGRTPLVKEMYPSVDWFANRFSAALKVNTITPPSGIKHLMEQDRAQMQAEYEQQITEAQTALYSQLEHYLKDMLERFSDPEAIKHMRSSAWKNFDQFLDDLPVKVLDDADPILSLRNQIRAKIGDKLPDDLKDDLPKQRDLKAAAKEGLDALADVKLMCGM